MLRTSRFLALIAGLSICVSVQAATLDDILNAIHAFNVAIVTRFEESTAALKALVFEKNPSQEATAKGNLRALAANISTRQITATLANENVVNSLTQEAYTAERRLASLQASDMEVPRSTYRVSFAGSANLPNITEGDVYFDANTLLGTSSYKNSDDALTYLRFLGLPVMPDLVSLSEITNERALGKIRTSAEYRQYRLATRSLTAANSMALTNFYQMVAERTPQKDLGKIASAKDISTGEELTDASPLQIRNYLAQRRSKEAKWYEEMSEASPSTVWREMLFILAEMREEQHALRQDNERLLATVSAMQLLLNTSLRIKQSELAEQIRQKKNQP